MSLLEIDLRGDASQFEITKLEEQHAFNYYKEKLLPGDVKEYNSEVKHYGNDSYNYNREVVTIKEVIDNMRKTYHNKATGISGTQIKYVAEIHQEFNQTPIYFILEISREKIGLVTLRHWHIFSKIASKVDLQEGYQPLPDNWGNISKMDEAAGFQVIKNKWVPEFVRHWNKNHPVHKVTEHSILQTLRKVRHDSLQQGEDFKKWPRSDIIHYQAVVPGPDKHVTFMIHRYTKSWSNEPRIASDGTLVAGYFMGTALFEKPVYAN